MSKTKKDSESKLSFCKDKVNDQKRDLLRIRTQKRGMPSCDDFFASNFSTPHLGVLSRPRQPKSREYLRELMEQFLRESKIPFFEVSEPRAGELIYRMTIRNGGVNYFLQIFTTPYSALFEVIFSKASEESSLYNYSLTQEPELAGILTDLNWKIKLQTMLLDQQFSQIIMRQRVLRLNNQNDETWRATLRRVMLGTLKQNQCIRFNLEKEVHKTETKDVTPVNLLHLRMQLQAPPIKTL